MVTYKDGDIVTNRMELGLENQKGSEATEASGRSAVMIHKTKEGFISMGQL